MVLCCENWTRIFPSWHHGWMDGHRLPAGWTSTACFNHMLCIDIFSKKAERKSSEGWTLTVAAVFSDTTETHNIAKLLCYHFHYYNTGNRPYVFKGSQPTRLLRELLQLHIMSACSMTSWTWGKTCEQVNSSLHRNHRSAHNPDRLLALIWSLRIAVSHRDHRKERKTDRKTERPEAHQQRVTIGDSLLSTADWIRTFTLQPRLVRSYIHKRVYS